MVSCIAVVGVLVLFVLVLAFVDWNRLKGPVERFASARSGREVSIDGGLDADIWSWAPRLTLERLTVGGPPWDDTRPMLRIERVEIQLQLLPLLKGDVILPRVALIKPDIYLHRDAAGRANWSFANTRPSNAPASPPPKLPVVRDFLIQSGGIALRDEILHLKVRGTVQAREKGAPDDPQAFRVHAKGTLNQEPFVLNVAGGPLVNLDPDSPYPFDLVIRAGDIDVEADGKVLEPFDLGRLQLAVHATGGDLADLFYLTQLALPNTPPFDISASIERDVSTFEIKRLAGRLGESDVSGELHVDASKKRPMVSGSLVSKQLRLSDLAPSLGAGSASAASLQGAAEAPQASPQGAREPAPSAKRQLFPDARLQVNRVRGMDADVRFRADAIHAGTVPVKAVSVRVRLDDGLLMVNPVEIDMPQGKVSGTVRIDARKQRPKTELDMRIKDLQLDQLKGKSPDAKPPLGGKLLARVVLKGNGDSVHDVMASADGRVYVIVPSGEVRAAFAELTGINVARGLGLLLKGDEERADIRCGIAQFAVKDGTMHAEKIVFDTEDVRITGRGEIRLGPEAFDLEIKGEPKKLRIARLRTPVEVGGYLRKPALGIDASQTAKQGAIAVALGAITPLAAVLAFVDPGLAKDENCVKLLTSTRADLSRTLVEKK